MKQFYEEVLGHLVMKLPDTRQLGMEPHQHIDDMTLILLLLLGCAMESPNKQYFMNEMYEMNLDETTQMALVEYITQVCFGEMLFL